MGQQASCCSCNYDSSKQEIDFDKAQNIQPSFKGSNPPGSLRSDGKYSNRKKPSGINVSNLTNSQNPQPKNHLQTNNLENQSFGKKQSRVEVHQFTHSNNDGFNIDMRNKGISMQAPQNAFNQANEYIEKEPEKPGHKKGEYSVDNLNNQILNRPGTFDPVGKSKTEVLQGQTQTLKAGVSSIVNPRYIDNTWLSSFKVLKVLEKEVFSELYLIKMSSPQSIAGELRVMRKIRKVMFQETNSGIEDFRFSLEELLQLEHPNIAQIYDYKEDSYNFYVVIEYCQGGKLFRKIEELTEMTENLAAEICRQILSSIVYIHSKSYVYRNLNPDVLLLETDENIVDGFNLKLVNLDLQCALSQANPQLCSIPLYFQSPETLKLKKYTDKLDVWSTGVLLAILLTGVSPQLMDGSSFQLVSCIIEGRFDFGSHQWSEISPNAIELVRKLLDLDDDKRIKAVTALNDKWLLNITKAKRNNQRKILNQQAELRFYQSICEMIQQHQINKEEEKAVTQVFRTKDPSGLGDLKMDQIREAYSEYCGRFVEKEEIDKLLENCTVFVSKGGSIKYSQFVQVKSKKAMEFQKNIVKKNFTMLDQKRFTGDPGDLLIKPNLLAKQEVRKMLGAIITSNNDQTENFFKDFDKDQDGFQTIDEAIAMVIHVVNHL
ncbi:protein kinase domain containing protein [Stylonychia lemnae]|uniref:Protein kinase domain containing protein n=1 Tax=Stylonychia lemnae TaxID=5949 RepID=A0A077ZPL2_STYLE|nr:protein kinase domain containing protein [Stylonychia lemnae]|eukprot:CDW71305.1 protein kinase domain containing protein [Stylonychia lemnae]